MKAYVTIGLPRSGKSTWASKLPREVVEINLDDCREAVNGDAGDQTNIIEVLDLRDALIETAAMDGADVCISDTNINPVFRRQLVEQLRGLGYDVQAVVLNTPLDVCVARNARAERKVPLEVIFEMHRTLTLGDGLPSTDEGFCAIAWLHEVANV